MSRSPPPAAPAWERNVLSMREVARHATPRDLWVVIKGRVYDLTAFHASHPGGARVVAAVAGKDATQTFDPFHPADIIQRMGLTPIGVIDKATVRPEDIADIAGGSGTDTDSDGGGYGDGYSHGNGDRPGGAAAAAWVKPALGQMLNFFDFEAVAKKTLSKQGWSYYSSGADDEITLRENHAAFQRIWLRPRVLVNVREISTGTHILGQGTDIPVYLTATALGKLAHPEGELAITRAAGSQNVIYMLPTLSSYTLDEMLGARAPGQVQFGQLYVNGDRGKTRAYVEQLERGGCKGLFITVDAPQLGRREKDMRNKFTEQGSNVQKEEDGAGKVGRGQGVARAISEFIDTSLCWDDLAWFRSITAMPICLKGVACSEDAVMALRAGCAGIVLSNHGGRQLDTARSGIEILAEVVPALDREDRTWRARMEVYVDGGVRRGSDIYKALAMGATAVGIGRPVLYSLSAFGQAGVERMLQLLGEELTMVMRLMGTPTVRDINPRHVITSSLGVHAGSELRDHLLLDGYQPLRVARGKL